MDTFREEIRARLEARRLAHLAQFDHATETLADAVAAADVDAIACAVEAMAEALEAVAAATREIAELSPGAPLAQA